MEKYKSDKYDIEERVEDLLSRMTVDEKIDQLISSGINKIDEINAMIEKGEPIHLGGTYASMGYSFKAYNKLQRYFVENTRLGIPCLLASEDLHGVDQPQATIYPSTMCMAATFDDSLVEKMGKLSGAEARKLGIMQVYAPDLDVALDPRWGRVEETYGEDTYLIGKMGVAFCKGLQSNKVSATIKHYISYGVGEGGINLAPAHIGEREIRSKMLPPFEECIAEGKAWGVMPSYNEIDGVPVHSSDLWLKKVLREELGFDGVTVTDYGAANMLYDFHYVTNSKLETGKVIIKNEIDIEASEAFGYSEDFRTAANNGEIDIALIDKCVRNVLRLKFRVGLFENPYIDEDLAKEVHDQSSIDLAEEIAKKGIVLLKNDGILPLKKDKKVCVLGANANMAQLGDFMYYPEPTLNGADKDCVYNGCKTLYGVLKERFGKDNVLYSQGSMFFYEDDDMLEKAIAVAKNSDIIILALGDNSATTSGGDQINISKISERKDSVTSGESYDMSYIELPPAQLKLIERAKTLGKPIIMLLYGGRPHAITEQVDDCSAILNVFHPGEKGSEAICKILLGEVNPSGKLPISFPRSTGHIPAFYNHKMSARGIYREPGSKEKSGRDYVNDTPAALYSFGYGLSYTKFLYSDLEVEVGNIDNVKISVKVKNIGEYDGDESVLLFSRCQRRIVTPEIKNLTAFKRVSLKKGESKKVEFNLKSKSFTFINVDMKKTLAYGLYDFMIDNLTKTVNIDK